MNTGLEIDEFNELNPAQRIPNSENRNLQTKILTQQQQFELTQYNLDENLTKVHVLEDHFKNVQDELSTFKRLINACKNETETEEHIKVVNQREIGRLKHNISQVENQLSNIKHRKRILTEEIVRANQLVDKLKVQTKWDEQDLETYLEESGKKDEDIMALMKYTRQDEVKVKEFLLKIERLSEESTEKKRAVDIEILDTTGFQVELDKTANHFQRSHLHRQELIKRWEDIIKQMHQRDRDIDLLAVKLIKLKAEVHSMDEQLNAQREFYNNEQRHNNEYQIQMSLEERRAAKLRIQYDEAEKNRLFYENELSGLRRVVERTGKDKEISYALLNQMKKQLTHRRQYLNEVTTHKYELINKKSDILNLKYTSEENANKMDQLYLEEQEREIRLNSRLKLLSERMYKITQELSDYQAKVTTLEVEINGSLVTLNHLQAKTKQLDNEALKQQQVLYHQDFEIQSFERRINRLQGEKSFEEQVKLEKKINELQIEMKQKRDDYTTLTNQTKQIHEELRRLKKHFDEINQEKLIELRQIEELEIHDDKAQRLIKKLKDEKENFLVDEHFMRIEVKRLRSLLNSKADNIMNLETRRLQLQTVIKERRNDISIHQSTLRQQIRSEEGRTSEISAQLHDRIAKIEKLKKRYEIANISMSPPEGVKQEETSQAYYVIKATEEKEELQRKGDDLNGKTRKAERELLALQNTLQILNNENNQIKTSYKKSIDPNNKKKQQILKLENDCKDIERKLIQADRNISSNKKSTQAARQQTKTSIEEDDFELRILKEFNKKLDLLIDQTVSMDPDAKHCYNILKEQSHFYEPSNTPSTSLSLPASTTSRTSSRQTVSIAPIQLSLEGSRLSNGNGHRQQRGSSSVKRVVK